MAAYTGWRSRLNHHQFCKQLRENNVKESHSKSTSNAKQLIAVNNGDLYVWDASASHLIFFHLEALLVVPEQVKNETYRHQTLLCKEPPTFEVENVTFNSSVSYVALWGQGGIRVMVLPRRWGKFSDYEGGKSVISCNIIPVAERLTMVQSGIEVRKVAWHPGSPSNNHLVVLTSDNMIRTFDITDPDKASQEINMDSVHTGLNISPTKLSFSAALGEKTVAFDFGEPFQLQQKKRVLEIQSRGEDIMVWPLYIMKGNGNVYVSYLNVSTESDLNLAVQGPLAMFPPADDNYGTEACDIMCLNCTPTVLVVSTSEGKVHHCLVLESSDDPENTTIQSEYSSKLSESMFYEPIKEPTLFVIESVELELSLTIAQFNSTELIEDNFTCPVRLQKDPSTFDRYHCSHSAGVHTVALPWADSLNTFVADDTQVNPVLPDNQECVVEHVICTKPLPSSIDAPTQGLAVVTDPSFGVTLLVLSSDYLFTALPLSSKYRIFTLPLASDVPGIRVASPLKKINQEPFDFRINKILQRNTSNPLLKSGSGTEVSQQECFQLLSRATQVLREEYIQKQYQAQMEIENRAKILVKQKMSLKSDLQKLEESRNILRDNAESIAEKLEKSKHDQEMILKRLELITRKIQSRLPMLSEAEKKYHKELQAMHDNLEVFSKSLKQLKMKQDYQKRQITTNDQSASSRPVLKKNQVANLKDILRKESEDIDELMKKVKQLNVDTSISFS